MLSLLMTRLRLFLVSALLCFSSANAQEFVQVRQSPEGWSFVQNGKPFYSMGVTTVLAVDEPPKNREDRGHYDGLAAHGSDASAWVKHTSKRLHEWGFNTLGGWCSDDIVKGSDLYFTKVLGFGYGGTVGNDRLCDVWSDAYAAAISDWAVKEVLPLANEPRLLGYFTNNELNWHGEYGWPTDTNDTLFDRYLKLPDDALGRTHLLEWLHRYFKEDFAKFREAFVCDAASWSELSRVHLLKPARFMFAQRVKYAWAGEVAERYFTLCEKAIRRHDTHHLILGCRFAASSIVSVIEAQGRHCDVIAINRYEKSGHAPLGTLNGVYALTGKPILITEYGWRAQDNRSGLKNTRGVDVTVPTQRDRALRLEEYMRGCMDRPFVLGMHWFQHHDEPTNGRFDGEDSNYGLVDQKDQPYEELTTAFTKLQREMQPGMKRGTIDPNTPKGWDENTPLAVAIGDFKQAVSLLPAADQRSRVLTSCDSEHGAKISMQPGEQGAWICTFSNGTGWGTAPGFSAPPDAHLAGAKKLRIRLQAPKDLLWRVIITEDGVHQAPHNGRAGADGESFTTETQRGTGESLDFIVWLEDLQLRWEYGNQSGNHRIDLQALDSISIGLPEAGKSGEVRILAIELTP